MNGVAVMEALRERPPETLLLEVDLHAQGARGYFAARNATEELEAHPHDPTANANTLAGFVLNHDSSALDVVPSMTHRYEQARNYMTRYADGHNQLSEAIHSRFVASHKRLSEGYVLVPAVGIGSAADNQQVRVDGRLYSKLKIPERIRTRSLVWNEWAQQKVKADEADELFTDEFFRHGAKAANGDLLPAGNLWVEVGEALLRIRDYPYVEESPLEQKWGHSEEDGSGWSSDDWFVMSHIAEKGILELADSLGPEMIDGMKLTDETYVRSYAPIIELLDLNPHLDIQGILSEGSWIYSEELARVFPDHHVSKLHDVAGSVVELGPAVEIHRPIQAEFATLHPERRAAYESGDYKAGVAARFIDRAGMVRQLTDFGISIDS